MLIYAPNTPHKLTVTQKNRFVLQRFVACCSLCVVEQMLLVLYIEIRAYLSPNKSLNEECIILMQTLGTLLASEVALLQA